MNPQPTRSAAGCSVGTWLRAQHPLPRLECELLVCHHLGIDRARVIACPERVLSTAEQDTLEAGVARLRQGEPLAYLLGEREFWGLNLQVSEDVLIPRPETETLVELALTHLRPGNRVLDLGTGSGAIAIALATSMTLEVVAVDSSPAALAVATANARKHQASVRFLHSDWFSALNEPPAGDHHENATTGRARFHLIVANPPYIAAGDPHLPALRHEPASALVSGPSGLDDLTRIITDAAQYLLPGGRLLVEHGWNQAAAIVKLFARQGYEAITTHQDLGGIDRVTGGVWSMPAIEPAG